MKQEEDEGSKGTQKSCGGCCIPPGHEYEPFPTLVPVNGKMLSSISSPELRGKSHKLFFLFSEESLRACFHHFEDIDIDHHKRFFRHLHFSDNVIKSKDNLPYEDKIHELLNQWVEKEGKEASLNHLLKVLLDLNQRRTAEMIKQKAISENHYVCEC